MKDIYTHIDSARVGLFKSLLDEAGIACFVRNEASSNMMADIPLPVFYPTLCVWNDADFNRAKAILDEYCRPAAPGAEWVCPNCKSTVPAGFESCWNCERERPAS